MERRKKLKILRGWKKKIITKGDKVNTAVIMAMEEYDKKKFMSMLF